MTSSKTQASLIDRRRFLEYTWCGVGVSLSLALLPGHEILASPRFGGDPFTLGVASGDPTDDGIVLWTRLAPEPANPDALGVERPLHVPRPRAGTVGGEGLRPLVRALEHRRAAAPDRTARAHDHPRQLVLE